VKVKTGATALVDFCPKPTAVRLNDGLADFETQAQASGLGGVEGLKNPIARLR
jgi:hypothetical protein